MMKCHPGILAGTALGLLMATAPLGAFPLQDGSSYGVAQPAPALPLILAQANCAEGESAEDCAAKQPAPAEKAAPAELEQKPHKKKQEKQAEPAPAEQATPVAEPEQKAAPAEQAAPAEPEQKPRKKKHEKQAEPAPAEQAAPLAEPEPKAAPAEQAAPAEPEQKPRKKKHEKQAEPAPAEQQAPVAEPEQKAAPAEQAAPTEPEQKPRKKKHEKQAEPAPAEQAAPAAEPEQKAAPADQAAPAEPEQKPRKKKQEKQAEPAPEQQQAPSEETAPTPEAKPAPTGEKAPAEAPVEATPEKAPTPAAAPEAPAKGEKQKVKKPVAEQPSPSEETAPAESKQPVQGEAPAEPNAAPILDSQKDANRPSNGEKRDKKNREKPANQNGEQAATPPPAAEQGPPPANDKAAQQEIRPEKIEPVTEEKGKRRDKAPDIRQRERREGVDVLKEIGDRLIIELGGRTMVESTDRSRMTHGARDVYYEDLPRGRTRETIERGNGDRVVTIRNRDGDIVQRSRITPDGREYVLNYVDEQHYDDRGAWRDPGDDLPPMRLTIPRNQYILDSESVESPDDYYEFLEQPPVERVQRLYSIQEVKRSARVRDIARRVDLDTLNFEFGSASIADSEIPKLEGVAHAMERLLEKNPAETFLIEGHTDAVGSEVANLALSDRRAEAVAEALTNVFGIPPENLTTQGYGEQYLKVNTQGPERQNRRVAIRRITSLVAPVASGN